VDLASKVGLTAPPCLRRMRTLEQSGAIKGYHADIDSASLGYSIMVFAMVSLKSQAEMDLRAFEEHIRSLPNVRECHMLNGEIDFILKIVAHDLQSFQEFLTTKLTSAPNVSSVKTSLTIRTAKDEPGVPIPE
jgi:DNA-binding Lrp family transcriptional regulator